MSYSDLQSKERGFQGYSCRGSSCICSKGLIHSFIDVIYSALAISFLDLFSFYYMCYFPHMCLVYVSNVFSIKYVKTYFQCVNFQNAPFMWLLVVANTFSGPIKSFWSLKLLYGYVCVFQ